MDDFAAVHREIGSRLLKEINVKSPGRTTFKRNFETRAHPF